MAATSTSKPLATLIALAALLLGVLALTVPPASASQLTFYSGPHCVGSILGTCKDYACCDVPAGAVSYEFHYVPGFIAYLYPAAGCGGTSNGNFTTEIPCTDYVGFQSALLPGAALKMPTDQ